MQDQPNYKTHSYKTLGASYTLNLGAIYLRMCDHVCTRGSGSYTENAISYIE